MPSISSLPEQSPQGHCLLQHTASISQSGGSRSPVVLLPAMSFLDDVDFLQGGRGITEIFHNYSRLALQSWTCSTCGEENVDADHKCDWCGAERDLDAPVGHRLWLCTVCETINPATDSECQNCRTSRPEPPQGMHEDMFQDVEIGSVVSEDDALNMSVSMAPMSSPPRRGPTPWVCFECSSINIRPFCERCGTERRTAEQWTLCPCGVAHALISTRSTCIACGTPIKRPTDPLLAVQ
eukprot:GGOE01063434.1.p3 GENE.GGOE01063434.1~~GGOE01063434.1.p3  ORF type:complete len:238 (+),score=37.56 GGOE01063434.1:1814-2527(+)